MTNNQTVCPNSESSCSIDGGIEIMEANVDTKLSDDKDADQKELFPRDYQVRLRWNIEIIFYFRRFMETFVAHFKWLKIFLGIYGNFETLK